MGLSGRLLNPRDPLRRFIQSQFAHVDTIRRDLRERASILNFVPPNVEKYVFARIGWALDYRLRLYFAESSPFKTTAVQGAVQMARRPEIVEETAYLLDVMFRTSPGNVTVLPDDERRLYVLDDMDALTELTERLDREGLSGGCAPIPCGFAALGRAMTAEFEKIAPVGRALDADEERRLCGMCYLLGHYESARYHPEAIERNRVIARIANLKDVDAQLALVPAAALDDVSAMSHRFSEVARNLLGQKAVVDPHFPFGSSGWSVAEADLVVGSTLIEIKTSRTLPTGLPFIYQLVGYLLADTNDAYQIAEVGWYLARYGALVTWPVTEFLDKLAGRAVDLASLRARVLPVEQW
jgi:hypothetical protein